MANTQDPRILTQALIQALTDLGCPVEWVGEDASEFYDHIYVGEGYGSFYVWVGDDIYGVPAIAPTVAVDLSDPNTDISTHAQSLFDLTKKLAKHE